MDQFLNRYLITMSRSIEFSINFNCCVGAMFITRFMPRIIIQVIANSCNISIRLLRGLGILGRTIT